jgi:hypothetical protein
MKTFFVLFAAIITKMTFNDDILLLNTIWSKKKSSHPAFQLKSLFLNTVMIFN